MTPRLCLRKVKEEDLPLLAYWSNSTTAHGAYLTPDRTSEGRCRDDYQAGTLWNRQNKIFIIELKDDGPIGTIHYWLRPERKQCAVMAVKIAEPSSRCRGYGTEAQKHIIINLFQRMKVDEIEMYTDINNDPQQCCLKKLGFELVESLTYEDHQVTRTGHLYRIDSDSFLETPMYHFHYE